MRVWTHVEYIYRHFMERSSLCSSFKLLKGVLHFSMHLFYFPIVSCPCAFASHPSSLVYSMHHVLQALNYVQLYTALATVVHLVRLFPLPPSSTLASSPPLCPTLSDVTTDSLVVSWYPPNTPKGIITEYGVRRGRRNSVLCFVYCFHCKPPPL